MRVSVIIPCRNAAPWIAGALASVAAQTVAPYEVIVIDDASTDGSLTEIERSAVPSRVLRVKAGNAAAARNAGIQVAAGDWVALLDADDVWYPDHLARARQLLSGSRDVAFMSNHDWIDVNGAVTTMPAAYRCKLTAPRTGLTAHDYYLIEQRGFHFGHSTVVYSREALNRAVGFDESQRRRHDLDLWLRIIAGGTWAYDTVKGAGYREDTPGSLSKDDLECDYYALRAMVKNLDVVPTPLHRAALARQARRAIGIAFTDGSAAHYQRIRDLAWPHLPWGYRAYYSLGSLYPPMFRGALRARRPLVMGLIKWRRRLAQRLRSA